MTQDDTNGKNTGAQASVEESDFWCHREPIFRSDDLKVLWPELILFNSLRLFADARSFQPSQVPCRDISGLVG